LILSLLVPRSPQRKINQKPRSLLILSYEKAGDALLTTALIRLIKQHLPQTEIYILAWSRNADIYLHDPHITRVLVVRKGLSWLRLLRTLRRFRFDMLYNPKDHPSTTFLLLTLWIRAECKVALHHWLQDRLYHCALRSSLHSHTLAKHRPLLEALHIPCEPEDLRPMVYVPLASAQRVDRFLERGSPRGLPQMLFNLSARPENQWEVPSWATLGRKVQEGFPDSRMVILAHPSDHAKARAVCDRIGDRAFCAPPLPTLLDVAALVRRMDLVVSPDTSIVHLCSALNIPLVGLYPAEGRSLANYAPWRIPHRVVRSHNRKVRSIRPGEVYAALVALWSEIAITARERAATSLLKSPELSQSDAGVSRIASDG
jgi:ADP-heptose:LPS heptosyltransferase